MSQLTNKILPYLKLMRLHKPIGIFLVLWPTLWALWIAAKGIPPLPILVIFVLGVFIMRACGCIINDIADRKIDPHIERTKDRPLASGQISTRSACILFIILGMLAFLLVLTLNRLTIAIAVAAFLLATLYPFMKRYTHLPQIILGLAFACSIPMAFAAVTNQVPAIAFLLMAITVCWTVAYDTQYAMVDRNDDIKIGVKSTAILFGRFDVVIIILLHMIVIALLIILGLIQNFTLVYWFSLIAAMGLFIYQQKLIRHRESKNCFRAFLNNNWVGFFIFVGIALNYFLKHSN